MSIHEGSIDVAVVRKWGYDEELLLLEQDEDLLLGDPQFYPVLAELASDPNCPKREYIVSIVDFALMFRVLRKHPQAKVVITDALALFGSTSTKLAAGFVTANRTRLELLDHPVGLTEERALRIGRAALNGVCRDAVISCCEQTHAWQLQLSVPPEHRHREWLTIDKKSGEFCYTWRGDCKD